MKTWKCKPEMYPRVPTFRFLNTPLKLSYVHIWCEILFPHLVNSQIFTVRCYALHCICYRNSVCLSVRPSVCLTRGLCPPGTIMISSPYGSPVILVSGDIKFIPKFEGNHPERGRWMRVGWVRVGDFRPISRRISETVRDTTKVTINH